MIAFRRFMQNWQPGLGEPTFAVSSQGMPVGNVDPHTFEIIGTRRDREGRLFAWLNTVTARPEFVSDLTPDPVEQFRNTWDFSSDLCA